MNPKKTNRYAYPFIKRLIDTIAAAVILVLAAPVMLVVAVAIKISSRGPILFRQDRPGLNEEIFRLYKFRTMTVLSGDSRENRSDAARLTGVGVLLRKTSIDELPQLINILRQEMSFIGPRPLLVRYLPFYSETERVRHSVRPGISGWAQVNGRNTLSWEDKFRFDVEYVNRMSLIFDFRIALLTIKKLFYRSEVITAGTTKSTMALDKERMHLVPDVNINGSNNGINA